MLLHTENTQKCEKEFRERKIILIFFLNLTEHQIIHY
jgi:hypothetical protein